MVPFLIFGALYAFAGILVAVLLSLLLSNLGAGVALLYGVVTFLVACLFHLIFYFSDRIRHTDDKFMRLRMDSNDLRDAITRLQDDVKDILTNSSSARIENVLSEVKIMQSVIDTIVHGQGGTTLSVHPAASTMIAPDEMDDATVIEAVREAIRTDRIDMFLQPIVSLPQRKLRFYEIFTRIRTANGGYLTPDRYLNIAGEHNFIPALDNLQLLRCMQMLRDSARRNSTLRFFINISSTTLRDNSFMTELVQFLGQNMQLAPKLVFELAQADLASLSADVFPLLDGLGRLGCRFSMDRVYSLDFPLAALQARKIRFIKVDADFIIDQMNIDDGARIMRDMKTTLDRNGIDLICSKLEHETQLREILDLNIDFGQGYLFGEPGSDWQII